MNTPEEPTAEPIGEGEEIEVQWIGRFLVLTAIEPVSRRETSEGGMLLFDYADCPYRVDPDEITQYGAGPDDPHHTGGAWILTAGGRFYVREPLAYIDAAMRDGLDEFSEQIFHAARDAIQEALDDRLDYLPVDASPEDEA